MGTLSWKVADCKELVKGPRAGHLLAKVFS